MLLLFVVPPTLGLGLIFFILWRVGKRSNTTWLQYVAGVPLFGLVGLFVFFVIMSLAWTLFQANPSRQWETTFDFSPPSDVTHIQSSFESGSDSQNSFLRFQAIPPTIHRIVKARSPMGLNFKRVASSQLINGDFSYFQNEATPSWWNPKITQTAQYYTASARNSPQAALHNEDEVLVYDPATQTAYYAFSGVD